MGLLQTLLLAACTSYGLWKCSRAAADGAKALAEVGRPLEAKEQELDSLAPEASTDLSLKLTELTDALTASLTLYLTGVKETIATYMCIVVVLLGLLILKKLQAQ